MAKGYLVVCYRKINNQEKWAAYAKLAAPAIQKAGGRFIVRGMPMKIYEQGVRERTVIVEFDTRMVVVAPVAPPPRTPNSFVPEPMAEQLSSVSSTVAPDVWLDARN